MISALTKEYIERTLESKTSLDNNLITEREILKPNKALQLFANKALLLFRFSVLDEIYCGVSVFGNFLRGFSVSNRPIRPPL